MLIIGLFRKADIYASLTVFFFFIEIVWNNIHLMHLFIVLPRRPRGSQSGREKRQDENFQVRAKEPLGTDSYRTISKNSSRCLLLIGHKKCFVLLRPIREQFLLSSFREFVHDGYLLWLMHQRNARSQQTFSVI